MSIILDGFVDDAALVTEGYAEISIFVKHIVENIIFNSEIVKTLIFKSWIL